MNQEFRIQLKQEVAVKQQTVVQMKILACPAECLKACIEAYTHNEPLIEIEQASLEEPLPEPPEEISITWDDWSESSKSTEIKRFEEFVSVPVQITLRDALLNQVRCIQMTKECYDAVFYLIDELTPDGYLPMESYTGAKAYYTGLEQALAILHSLEPNGIGARSVRECLEIQLRQMHCFDTIFQKLLDNLEDLAKKNYAKLEKKLRIPSSVIQAWYTVIQNLNPRPGDAFLDDDLRYITPDVTVVLHEDSFQIHYNSRFQLRTVVGEEYTTMMAAEKQDPVLKKYIRTSVQKSSWLNRCIQHREKVICQICAEIVLLQKDFFLQQTRELKPLTLGNIAERLDVHVSTVSRACAGKYMQTPVGTFPFSYFFSNAVVSDDKVVSASRIKDIMNDVIKAENPAEPYSDQQLCEILKEQHNILISRRTIAKYRVQLNIADSKRRKRLSY